MIPLLAMMGIMSAMNEEASTLLDHMNHKEEVEIGSRRFVKGEFEGMEAVFALSGIGKVAAGATAALMIAHFNVEGVVFTGVAGGSAETNIGDIVVGHSYVQHDLDARPIFPICYVPSLRKQILKPDARLYAMVRSAAITFLDSGICFPELGIASPKIWEGIILSGDQFVISASQRQEIAAKVEGLIPQFHAIEMEGAAVAQVCSELNVPFIVVRTISDKANAESPVDFLLFTQEVASRYSLGIMTEFAKIWTAEANKNIYRK